MSVPKKSLVGNGSRVWLVIKKRGRPFEWGKAQGLHIHTPCEKIQTPYHMHLTTIQPHHFQFQVLAAYPSMPQVIVDLDFLGSYSDPNQALASSP